MQETQEIQQNGEQPHIKQTKKQLFWEIFRFLLVGGTATVFDYVVAYLFYQWILPEAVVGHIWSLIISTALGFSVGLTVNWILSIKFVYRQVRNKEKAQSKQSFLVFTIIGLIGLGITELGMLLVPVLPTVNLFNSPTFLGAEWTWWMAKVVMTCIVLVFNYLGRKLLIFKS